MLLDINESPVPTSSYPREFTEVGDDVYFITTNQNGDEVWKTDGETAEQIADFGTEFNPADFGGTSLPNRHVSKISPTNAGIAIAFEQDSGVHNPYFTDRNTREQFYISDGVGSLYHSPPFIEAETWNFNFIAESNGLVSIDDTESVLIPETDGGAEDEPVFGVLGDIVFTSSGGDVWRSDGTIDGTFPLSSNGGTAINPPSEFRAVGGLMFYVTAPANGALEVWASDGTQNGTLLVGTIHDPPFRSRPPQTLATSSHDGEYYVSLLTDPISTWRSDGMTTVMHPGRVWEPSGEIVAQLRNRVVYWDAENEYLSSTKLDSTVLHQLHTGNGSFIVSDFFVTDLRAYFVKSTNSFPEANFELWSTGGDYGTTRYNATITLGDEFPPNDFVTLDNRLVFANTTDDGGRELWIADGTIEGVFQLKDIAPGVQSSNPTNFIAFQDKVFFNAETEEYGNELWVTDGTEAGTHLVKDINRGVGGSDASEFTIFDNRLWFSAYTDGSGIELWSTDGTIEGTIQLQLAPSIQSANPTHLTALGDRLYFSSEAGGTGFEPWVSDGTLDGTHLLANVEPERNDHSQPRELTILGNKVFFSAEDAEHGNELWVSDGTAEGTQLVKDIAPGLASSDISEITVWNSLVYFTASDDVHGRELWRSDGTADGTQMVGDILPGLGGSAPFNLFPSPNMLLFVAYDHESGDDKLWTTNGTPGGTRALTPSPGYDPSLMVSVDDKVFFAGETDYNEGRELWVTDGTTEGTQLAAVISDSTCARYFHFDSMAAIGNELFFTSSDSIHCRLTRFDTESRQQETIRITDQPFLDSAVIEPIAQTDDSLVLLARRRFPETGLFNFVEYFPDTGEFRPYGSQEPHPLLQPNTNTADTVLIGDEIFFSSFEPPGFVHVTRDGSTPRLFQDGVGDLGTFPVQVAVFNDLLYFVATSESRGIEVWQSDGTPAGTKVVTDIAPSLGDSFPSQFVQLGNQLVFRADDGFHGSELWTIDLPAAPAIQFSHSAYEIKEDGTMDREITVRRSELLDTELEFTIEYTSETATGTGTEQADFRDESQTFVFQPFQSEVLIPAPSILDDAFAEQTEYFSMRVVTANSTPSLSNISTFAIVDDDVLGDVNGDGDLSIDDMNRLVSDIVFQAEPGAEYDLNFDGILDIHDVETWLEVAGPILHPQNEPFQFGDANLDGIVDASDWRLQFSDYDEGSAAWSEMRDFNADGVNDASDFNIWANNRFREQPVTIRHPRSPRAAIAVAKAVANANEATAIPSDATFEIGRRRSLRNRATASERRNATIPPVNVESPGIEDLIDSVLADRHFS